MPDTRYDKFNRRVNAAVTGTKNPHTKAKILLDAAQIYKTIVPKV